MHTELLQKIGLNESEIEVYEFLLNHGEASAGEIIESTSLKRGSAYNMLYILRDKGLIEEFDKNNKAFFRPEHPQKLLEMFSQSVKDMQEVQAELEQNLPDLTQVFSKKHTKPAVRYFEGSEGMQEILADTLTAAETVYQYTDLEAVNKHLPDINDTYMKLRKNKEVHKKHIIINYDEIPDGKLGDKFMETRIVDRGESPFRDIVMYVYDDKISYLTVSEDGVMGVIISDPRIYSLHRHQFEFVWERLASSGNGS